MLEEHLRRRAMRPEVRVTRSALMVVRPIYRQIGAWQATTVKLLAIGEKMKARGRYDQRSVAEAEALFRTVEGQRLALDREASLLPPAVAGHSRFTDTAKALSSISAGLERALQLLSAQGPDDLVK